MGQMQVQGQLYCMSAPQQHQAAKQKPRQRAPCIRCAALLFCFVSLSLLQCTALHCTALQVTQPLQTRRP